jgi:HSP20 family protein
VNADEIEAAYDNGVLTINVPKAEESKPHRIEIQ